MRRFGIHRSFRQTAKAFFDQIYTEKKVFVRSDFKTRSLKVYGEPNALEGARQTIKREVERRGQLEIKRALNREWVGFFVREGLGKLAELLGEENVKLDIQPRVCTITIKGEKPEEANHYLQRLIDQARAAVIVDSVLPSAGEDSETCPVCSCNLSHPEQLGCGHSYCSGCLKHFLTARSTTRPSHFYALEQPVTFQLLSHSFVAFFQARFSTISSRPRFLRILSIINKS
jgi:hypothetical protein